jgi:hypothetical protein
MEVINGGRQLTLTFSWSPPLYHRRSVYRPPSPLLLLLLIVGGRKKVNIVGRRDGLVVLASIRYMAVVQSRRFMNITDTL